MSMLRRATQAMKMVGVDPGRAAELALRMPRFVGDAIAYRRAAEGGRFPLRLGSIYPVVSDYAAQAGEAGGHYFHQDLWAARKIHARRPARHVDVGSRIDGFVAHLLVFMPVEVVDIRPLSSSIPNLTFVQEDATTLARFPDNSLDSLSTLHAVEHFGLGRYGDPIDPDGWRRAVAALARVLAPGGRLYFSVPIGRERVVFNAHRVFSPRTVIEAFGSLRLVSFSAVDDAGDLVPDADPDRFEGAHMACGLFELTK
jgi:SAM-dependent methyltransferase